MNSCLAFDGGNRAEAARIATALRVLLHHTADTPRGSSHALLKQAGLLDDLYVLDTAGELELDRPESTWSLTCVHVDVVGDHEAYKHSFAPKFDGDRPYVQPDPRVQINALLQGKKAGRAPGLHIRFDRWWEQTVINVPNGKTFSREDLVKTVANKDGGAHVDPTLDDDYYALTRLNSLEVYGGGTKDELYLSWGDPDAKFTHAPDVELTALSSPVPASIRQIAWELTKSLAGRHPYLMPKN